MLNLNNESWLFLLVYLSIGILSFVPVFAQLFRKSNTGNTKHIDGAKLDSAITAKLHSRVGRDEEALSYWKKYIYFCKSFKFYSIIWVTLIGIFIPIITQFSSTNDHGVQFIKTVITVISLHSAIILTFNRVLKIDANYNTYRTAAASYTRNLNITIWSSVKKTDRLNWINLLFA